MASPLLMEGLTTFRGLAFTLRRHSPVHSKRTTLIATRRDDEKRFEKCTLLVDDGELMAITQRKEGFVLEFETEMRAADKSPTLDQ